MRNGLKFHYIRSAGQQISDGNDEDDVDDDDFTRGVTPFD